MDSSAEPETQEAKSVETNAAACELKHDVQQSEDVTPASDDVISRPQPSGAEAMGIHDAVLDLTSYVESKKESMLTVNNITTSSQMIDGQPEKSVIPPDQNVSVKCIGGPVTKSKDKKCLHFKVREMQTPCASYPDKKKTTVVQVHDGDAETPARTQDSLVETHLHIHETVTNITIGKSSNVSVGGTLTVNSGPEQRTGSPQINDRLTAIRDNTSRHLQEWTAGMVQTKAVNTLVDRLSKGPTVFVLKGNPGEGKTTVAKMALKKLEDMGRHVFNVRTPGEFFAVKSVDRSVILLNDVFGSSDFNLDNLSRWENVLADHLALEEHTQKLQPSSRSTLLLVTRSSVLDSATKHLRRFHSLILNKDCVMDLTKDVKYTVEEKVQIWSCYARQYKVHIEERIVREVCKMTLPYGFPHCCRLFGNMYSKNKNLEMKGFFMKPLEFLQLELKSVFADDFVGWLLREMLSTEGEYCLESIQVCSKRLSQIKKKVQEYEGLYLRREENIVTFHHPSIYDAVAFIACEEDPVFVVENCSLTFINDRVRLEGLCGSDIGQQMTVTIDKMYRESLLDRMKNEIEAGNISDVLSHNSFHDECFVRDFMEKVLSKKHKYHPCRKVWRHVLSEKKNLRSLGNLIQKRDHRTGDSFLFLCTQSRSNKVLKYICERVNLSKQDEVFILLGICRHSSTASMQYFLERYPGCDLSVRNERKETLLIVAAQHPCDDIMKTLIYNGVRVDEEDPWGRTALYYVCFHGVEKDTSIVKMMVMKGVDVNKCDRNGETPLFAASRAGRDIEVKALLDIGANIIKPNRIGYRPLTIACCHGYSTVVTTLLAKGANVEEVDGLRSTPLTTACFHGSNTVVTVLLDSGANVNKADRNRKTPLTAACSHGHEIVVRTLIERGAEIDKTNGFRYTPLTAACLNGHNTVVTILLEKGASITTRNAIGFSPLTAACCFGQNTVVTTLLDKKADLDAADAFGYTPLTRASYHGHKEIVVNLLDRGADVDKTDNFGYTPLYTASYRGHDAVVATLLNRITDVNKPDEMGITPLSSAIRAGHSSVVETLLSRVTDIGELYHKGETPLTIACRHGHNTVVKMLLDKGANINEIESSGYTPLTMACYYGRNAVVAFLLDREADINKCDASGCTPLTTMCKRSSICSDHNIVLTTLLYRGADVNKSDEKGNTPLTAALINGNAALVPSLLDRGADVNQSDRYGNTPLSAAERCGHDTVIQTLLAREGDGGRCYPRMARCRLGEALRRSKNKTGCLVQ